MGRKIMHKNAREALELARKTTNTTLYINKLDKWLKSDKKSRKLAIEAFCSGCMGCEPTESPSGYQEAIRGCTAPECPLFNFRPYK
jgi:hypothetical protein